MPKVKCDACGNEFSRPPSAITKHVFCNRACANAHKGHYKGRPKNQLTKSCEMCGIEVTRCVSQMRDHVFCGSECSSKWLSMRMIFTNDEWNKDKMTLEVRTKLRNFRLGSGEGKSYEKTFGVHTHRVVAEQMLGRKLKVGEVVHHIDENKRNNAPENLMVFSTQAEHAAWHKKLKA